MSFAADDRVEYVAAPVYDLIIDTGEVGVVTRLDEGWVWARWPRCGEHGVPLANVRQAYRLEVAETSAGAYLVTGRDSRGRSICLRGEDCDALAREVIAWLDKQNDVAV